VKKSQFIILNLVFALLSLTAFGQAPIISYSPASSPVSPITLTQNSTVGLPLTPTSSPNVAAFGYSQTGFQLTGGTLQYPWGIGVDPNSNIYVVNYTAQPGAKGGKGSGGSISKYNSSGVYQSLYGGGNLQQPTGIVFDKSSNGYILNYSLSDNGNQKGAAYIEQYSPTGADNGSVITGLGYPATGLAIDASNNLYVASGAGSSTSNVSEYVIGNSNPFLVITAPAGSNFSAVGVDGSYNIYVLDNAKNQVLEYSSTGAFITTVLTGLNTPNAFYVDGAGDIFVGNSGNGTVTIYNPNLAPGSNTFTLNGFSDPRGIATDNKGYLYISDIGNNTLKQYAPTGGYFISGQLPAGLTFNSTTGTISGAPTSGFATTTYTVTGYNASGAGSTTVSLYCPSSLSILYNPSVNVFTIGSTIPAAYQPTPTINPSNAAGLQFSISPSLPTGLTINAGTGIISGTVSNTVAASSQPTVYTITAKQGTTIATTTISIMCVADNYWTGRTNNDWNTGSNWSAGHVPTSSENATIGVHAYPIRQNDPKNNPIVSSTTAAYVVTFGAATPPTLTIQSGATLTINTMLTINTGAVPTFVTGTGGGSIALSSNSITYIYGTLTTADNLITLQSTPSGSASVGQVTGSIIGKVNVQRYLSGQRGYRLIASPVNATNGIADANGNLPYSLNYVKNSAYITGTTLAAGGFDVSSTVTTTSENPTLYLFREDVPVSNTSFISGNFRGISDITSTPTYSLNNEASTYTIPASNGFLFFFRGNRASDSFDNETKTTFGATAATLTASGYLNQGQIIFRDWYTPSSTAPGFSNPNVVAQGFNLVSNPYASTIDLDTYNTDVPTQGIYASKVDQFIYELNTSGSYGIYKAGSAGAVYVNNGSRYIVSGQAFFTHATATGGMLIFNETAKYALQQASPNLYMASKNSARALAATSPGLQMLRLEMALDTLNTDNIMVIFDKDSKPGYVLNEDALYRVGSGKVSLSSISADNNILAINQLPLRDGLTIPLKVGSNAYSTYTLNLKETKGIPQLYDIWMKDAYTGDSVSMRANPSYKFSITPDTGSYGAHRFTLIIRQNPGLAYHLLNFTATKATGKQVQITWTTENEFDYTNFTVERSTDGGATYTTVGSVPATGAGSYGLLDKYPGDNNLYRLKQEDINIKITYSSIIPVNFEAQGNPIVNNNVNIYPNPAVSIITTTVNVAANEKNAVYKYTITNNYGLIVRQGTSPQTNWQTNVNDLLPGTYIIQVVNNKDKSFVGQSKLVKL